MPPKKLFLSSTGPDLDDHRANVIDTIGRLDGWQTVHMEHFGARDESPDEYCQAQVADCDVFVAIVGQRYGTIHEPTGKSFTEREYDAAVRHAKHRLIFLSPNDFLIKGDLVESDYKRGRLKKFRERVSKEIVRDTFRSPEDLSRRVVVALQNLEFRESQARQVASSTAPLVVAKLSGPPTFRCEIFSGPPRLRSECLSDPLSEVLLRFSCERPYEACLFDITVSFNGEITNHLDSNYFPVGLALTGSTGENGDLVVLPARVVGGGTLTFEKVRVNPSPGRPQDIRISGWRGNAAAVGAGGDLWADVRIEPSTGLGLVSFATEKQVKLGYVFQGLIADYPDPGISWFEADDDADFEATASFRLKLEEGFSSAFRSRAQEHGPEDQKHTGRRTGTRFMARFWGVKDNVTLAVSVRDVDPTVKDRFVCPDFLNAVLVRGTDDNGGEGDLVEESTIGRHPGSSVAVSEVAVIGNNAIAIWEWVGENPDSFTKAEEVEFGVVLRFKPKQVRVGSMQVACTFAPLGNEGWHPKSTASVPRFIDTGGNPSTVFSWIGCFAPRTEFDIDL